MPQTSVHKPKVIAVIPARYASSRFPGKVLADLAGKPMIQRVWEQVQQATRVDEVVVATDDERVRTAVQGFGGHVIMTSPHHPSGTDRLAEACEKLTADLVVNVQGDEPLIAPETIDLVVTPLLEEENLSMASAKVPIENYHDYVSPHVVKVVCDDQDLACYFSRAAIPWYRDAQALLEQWKESGKRPEALRPPPMKHIGVYAYRTDFLGALTKLPVSELERAENLEQLRAISWGFKIKVPTTPYDSISVDVPQDLEKVTRCLQNMR